MTTNPTLLGPIEHVIVLMFENRSFDNMLGGLYPSGPGFDGVPDGWSNPVDPYHEQPTPGAYVQAFQAPTGYAARIMPYPDPMEEHASMMAQIDNGSMQGFLANYAAAVRNNWTLARNIMQYYAPGPTGNIPITSALASAYAVSDTYFGSGPVQTWPNRLFAHCATPGSYTKDGIEYAYLNNTEYPRYPIMDGQLPLPSIFELFDKTKGPGQKNWKVYHDGEWPISTVVDYVYKNWHWTGEDKGNVFSLADEHHGFYADITNNALPAYSFIEPRYQEATLDPLKTIPPNSNHPGSASAVTKDAPPIDIQFGEQLLKEIYTELAANDELFKKTLLIVTYDEHGGCFDHVAPPLAVSPFTMPMANFDYAMYGPRVPAIFINPYIKGGSVLRPGTQAGKADVFDHTSIIATLRDHFNLGGPLTPRDRHAPVFEGLIDIANGINAGPDHLPDLDLKTPKRPETDEPLDPSKVDTGSLGYVMYEAVLEKRRRLDRTED